MDKRVFAWQIVTWCSLSVGVLVGYIFNLNFADVLCCVVGWALFSLGMYVHYLSHKAHPKAHEDIDAINYVATRGIYSWVRHPGYLGLALAFFGVAIAFGSVPALIVAASLTISHYVQAIREEDLLLRRFGDVYARYMEEVPDRFVPIRKIIRACGKTVGE